MWQTIVDSIPQAPEAPEAELELARTLRRTGDTKTRVLHIAQVLAGDA